MLKSLIWSALIFGTLIFSGCMNEKVNQSNAETPNSSIVNPNSESRNNNKLEKSPTIAPSLTVKPNDGKNKSAEERVKPTDSNVNNKAELLSQKEYEEKAMDLLKGKIGKVSQGTALMFSSVQEIKGIKYYVIEHFEAKETHKANIGWYYIDLLNKKVYKQNILTQELEAM